MASRRGGISYKILLAWRDRFLKGGDAALQGKGPGAQVKALENENKQLKEALAGIALRVELKNFAPRASELFGAGSGAPGVGSRSQPLFAPFGNGQKRLRPTKAEVAGIQGRALRGVR